MHYREQQDLIERECVAFREELGGLIEPEWPDEVRAVAKYLHEHLFDEHLRMRDACEACGVHGGRFRQVFKWHCRKTMKHYCEDKRLLLALRLLRLGALDLACIAFSIGYGSYRTFGRAFKRRLGQSPQALREILLEATRSEAPSLYPDADAEVPALRQRLAA